jgi:hypothetical protein
MIKRGCLAIYDLENNMVQKYNTNLGPLGLEYVTPAWKWIFVYFSRIQRSKSDLGIFKNEMTESFLENMCVLHLY